MSQREKLERRVRDILDKHIEDQRFASPDSPNLLSGGAMAGAIVGGARKLHMMGAGGIADFLRNLASGTPLPVLLGRLLAGKGGCMDCEGGVITEKTKAGLKNYQEFMKARKAEGYPYQQALQMWRDYKCGGVKCSKAKKGELPPPLPELLLPNPEQDKDLYSECMKALGLPAEPAESEVKEQQKVRAIFDEEIDEAMEKDFDPDLLGMGRKGRKPRKPRASPPDTKGLDRYREAMRLLKERGFSHKEALEIYRELKAKKGGNWFDNITKTISDLAPVAPLLLPLIL